MSDQEIACSECGDTFVFTVAEQNFYREKGLASPPKRCRACRQARKAAGGSARPRPQGDHRGPPRDDRRPRDFAPRDGGFRPRGNAPRGNAPRGPREGQGNGGGYDARRSDRPSHRNGNASEYRSPAFPERRWEPRRDEAPRAPRPPRGERPQHGAERNPNGGERTHAEPAPRAPRPERERFDITCATCGVAAQVPFKPIEGRQVFCQECYRARRGTARPSGEPLDVSADAESDIVE